MAYRFLNPAPVFFNIPGTQPLTGGSLQFYDIGTTTPKATYSNYALTTPNSNPVVLDSSGRANTNIWIGGNFTVVLKDALGALVWTRDVRPETDAGLAIPALAPGFLTNDLSNLLWQEIRQLPDPTGSTDQYLVTNGATYVLTNVPTVTTPDPQIVVTATSFRAGVSTDDTKFLVQYGTGSAAASGTKSTSAAIAFATAFGATPLVFLEVTGGGPTSAGAYVKTSVVAPSAAGATASFSSLTGGSSADNFSGSNITSPVTFNWIAFGTVEIAP